jgi:hypothetical protein
MHAEAHRIREAQDGRARAESTRQAALAAELAEADRGRAHDADRIRPRETALEGASA